MHSLIRSLLAFVTLGMLPLGCRQEAPAAPADVTLNVPAMN
jgi:hypothetical protein